MTPRRRVRLQQFLIDVLLGAAFPAFVRPDRWRERRSVRRHLLVSTAVRFATLSFAAATREAMQQAEDLARERAGGREPTREEITAAHNELFGLRDDA